MPVSPVFLLICVPVGLILGRLIPRPILLALLVIIGAIFLLFVISHLHATP